MVLDATSWQELRLHPLEGPLEARRYGRKGWPSNSNSDHLATTIVGTATRWRYRHDSTSARICSLYRSICHELRSPAPSTMGSADGLRATHAAAYGICSTYATAYGLRTAHAATDGLRTADATAYGLWPALTAMGAANVAAWLRPAHAAPGIPDANAGIPSATTGIPPTTTLWPAALLWTALSTFNKN